jgi:glycerophosphoryl diester phosphodiesterase
MVAPENTLPAFSLARKMGFTTIETDIQLTSDNIPVIIHDSTINRTSDGTGNVYEKTLEELKELDFGSWKSTMWAGTKIPTFEEMLLHCKNIGLDVFIEVKKESPWTESLITDCVNLVYKYGMQNHVTWISFSSTLLGYVKNSDTKAKLGLLMTTFTTAGVDVCDTLKTEENVVYAVANYSNLTDVVKSYMLEKKIPLIAYMFDTAEDCANVPTNAEKVLTNTTNVAKHLFDNSI